MFISSNSSLRERHKATSMDSSNTNPSNLSSEGLAQISLISVLVLHFTLWPLSYSVILSVQVQLHLLCMYKHWLCGFSYFVPFSLVLLLYICWSLFRRVLIYFGVLLANALLNYVPWLLAFFSSLITNNCFTCLKLMFQFSCVFKYSLVGKFLTLYRKEDWHKIWNPSFVCVTVEIR